jgi:hypothetical protein
MDSIKKEILTIGVGPQLNTFLGDVSPNNGQKIFTNNNSAISIDIEKRFGKVIGLQLMVIKGKLTDHYIPIGFQSKFVKSNLNIIFNTDNYFDNLHNFSIYSAIGFGIMKYTSSNDNLKVVDTINNLMGFSYEYDTPSNEDICLLAPISVGFKWKMNPYIQGRIYGTYNLLLSDGIDNQIQGSNDQYASLGFTLNYAFHKITKVVKEKIDIDLEKFDLTDEDGDGVIDLDDKCHHTPKKVKVDSKGCPQDSDKDGVPDYLDVEPKSKYILHVDEQGRSLTDSLIYYRSHLEDSVEIEKNQTFSIDTSRTDSLNIDTLKTNGSKIIIPKKDSIEYNLPKTDSSIDNEMNYNYRKNTPINFEDYYIKNDKFFEDLLSYQRIKIKEE